MVRERLGHANVAFTMNVYQHVLLGCRRKLRRHSLRCCRGGPRVPQAETAHHDPHPGFGSIAVAGFPKLGSAFAASSLGVAEVGTGQLARIVEREPTPP
ncbi:MAG: hypothetical protein ACREA0_17560 [bacterium]